MSASTLPSLIVITDWSLGEEVLLQRLGEVFPLSPRIAVQHRDPGAPARVFMERAVRLRELCARAGNPLFINGRLDVALLLDAHLHLPAHGLLPSDVRASLPQGRWISAAVHDASEAEQRTGADLYLVSPVFAAGSKPDDTRTPLGVEGFEALALQLDAPAYALGGITPENVGALDSARGVAVISAVLRAKDPRFAATRLLARGHPILA